MNQKTDEATAARLACLSNDSFRPDFGATRLGFADRAGISDSFLYRAGLCDLPPDRLAEARKYSDLTMLAMARLCVGDRFATLGAGELYTRAISSVDFTNLLSATTAKSVSEGYKTAPSTAVRWCQPRDLDTFKPTSDIKLSGFATVPEVNDAGEIQHGTIAESKETLQVKTYGLRFAITRKMFMNDDAGGFARAAAELGAGCKRKIDDLVYDVLTSNAGVGPTLEEDSNPLFHAARTTPNYVTGATYVLGNTGLAMVCKLMRLIVGLSGETLNNIPKFLLVPPSLADSAMALLNSRMLVAAGISSGTSILVPAANTWEGRFELLCEARLETATNGTTAYYAIAAPEQCPSMALCYLRGQREPIVERADPLDVLGIGWCAYHDVGAGVSDWRGIVRSAGA